MRFNPRALRNTADNHSRTGLPQLEGYGCVAWWYYLDDGANISKLQSLWMSDFMAVHTLEHLQCIVVMGVFLVSLSRLEKK